MSPADRYRQILPQLVRERRVVDAPERWDEMELQAHWFAGEFGREFQTTTGDSVRIVQFGVWNREAGPDFSDAAISINGGEARMGPIEFDPDARDWERHGHALNPAYENVLLHVFTRLQGPEFFTRTLGHRNVPQVLLDLSVLPTAAPNPQPEAKLGKCCAPLCELPEEKVREILFGAAHFRLRRKAAALGRLREAQGADEALFQSLAGALGYKSNKLPFTLLTQRLPLALLVKEKAIADSLLFGVSGFLTGTDLTAVPAETREYLQTFWEGWWQHRDAFARLVLTPDLWKLGGHRPANHPQRRLAGLAQLVKRWSAVRRLAERREPDAVWKFFAELSDPYWDWHYTVTSKKAARPMALVGESRVAELLVNVFFPLWSLDGSELVESYAAIRAPLSNRRAEVAAIRLLGGNALSRKLLKSAAMQQGFLQVYEDFCMQDASDCDQCLFPRQLAQW